MQARTSMRYKDGAEGGALFYNLSICFIYIFYNGIIYAKSTRRLIIVSVHFLLQKGGEAKQHIDLARFPFVEGGVEVKGLNAYG